MLCKVGAVKDFKFSRRWVWRQQPCGIQRHVVSLMQKIPIAVLNQFPLSQCFPACGPKKGHFLSSFPPCTIYPFFPIGSLAHSLSSPDPFPIRPTKILPCPADSGISTRFLARCLYIALMMEAVRTSETYGGKLMLVYWVLEPQVVNS
jgi:hypothetical protein